MLLAMSLAEIELAVRADDHRRAIALALAQWRRHRHPDLADLVALIGARWTVPPLAARSTTSIDFQDVWLRALERDPIGSLAPALATLTRAIPLVGTTPNHLRYGAWFERAAALADIADPRIGDAFVAVLGQMPFRHEIEERLYDPLLDQLARLGDIRQSAPLRELLGRQTWSRSWLRQLVARGVPPVLAALDEIAISGTLDVDALDRTFALLGGRPPTRRAAADDEAGSLVQLVVAALDDDGPREVLADFWLERDDPRGHLIALQLKQSRGTATAGDLRNAERLIKRHEEEWLGTLVLVSKQRLFRRGFLEELTLTRPRVQPAAWARVYDEPALATVRRIHRGNASEHLHARLVAAAPNLRAIP